METFKAINAHSILTTKAIITTQTFKGLAETLIGTDLSTKWVQIPNITP